jgi:Fe-S oxidoreductase
MVNAALASRRLAPLLKAAAGMARERKVPQFASRTFRALDASRKPANPDGPPVTLWADTFTNYFQPHIAVAAVRVLEAAGFNVRIPQQHLCCGRPLYDYGMLPTAKRYLHETLQVLRLDIEMGVPVVGLEPSCVAVFRDELLNLMPHDANARRLAAQTYTLAELLAKHAPDWDPPDLRGSAALIQVHCHQGAVMGYGAERALLERMGIDATIPDSGCCGMAGSFGYEAGDRYEVSIACGERVILPAVREARKDAIIIADGFSCREQIGQNTDRTAVHIAEVIALGLDRTDIRASATYPERKMRHEALEEATNGHANHQGRRVAAVMAAGLAVGAAGAAIRSQRRA